MRSINDLIIRHYAGEMDPYLDVSNKDRWFELWIERQAMATKNNNCLIVFEIPLQDKRDVLYRIEKMLQDIYDVKKE